MTVENNGRADQVAGRDISNNSFSIDLCFDGKGSLDQRVSIGTLFSGPVHIHVTVDGKTAPPKRGKKKAG